MQPIRFNYADVAGISIKNRSSIKDEIAEIFESEGKELKRLDYIFCTDDFLLNINTKFLNHDTYTDIITFDYSTSKEIVAEVYISVDRVKENSRIHGSTFLNEMLRVMFHGALHLCGYKDKKKSEITLMRKKEDYYLQRYEAKIR